MRFQPIKPDIILKDGDEIDHLRVIHTPGHTEGSICLYKTGDVLFAGDAVRTDRRGNLKLPLKCDDAQCARGFKIGKKDSRAGI